jgi:hypothetical protein
MEDCMICYNNKSNKVLPCSHSFCSNCCVRLNAPVCPYCRQVFIFNSEEIKQRIKLGILNGYKWDASSNIIVEPEIIIENEINNESFSRVRRNMYRRRRRTLTFEEVLEKRQQIKTKKARHWERKNNRLVKTNWWEN